MATERALVSISAIFVLFCSLYAVQDSKSPLGSFGARGELIAALGPVRPALGRLSGIEHLSYARVPRIRLSSDTFAVARKLYRASQTPSPEEFGAAAILNLIEGHTDGAISRLSKATALAPSDARLLSDLSAAYLSRGLVAKHASDIVLALAAADRAVQLDPYLPEARFNLALALEHSFLASEAIAAWNVYLHFDTNSAWAKEANQHRSRLESFAAQDDDESESLSRAALQEDAARVRTLVAEHPQQIRLYAEKRLLADWADARAAGREAEAWQLLDEARLIGQALAGISGDFMLHDTVEKIDRASGDGRLSSLLLAGHRAYGEGLALMAGQRDREALERFEQAVESLRTGGSPFRYRAMMKAASCAKNMLDHSQVRRWLEAIRGASNLERYPNLAGEVMWMFGVTEASLADFSAAISYYQSALPRFEHTGEEEYVAFIHYLMAESLRAQEDFEAAWQHRYSALAIGQKYPKSIALHNTLLDSAEAALREGKPEVALHFDNEMVSNALAWGTLVSKVEALLRRSRAYQQLAREELAEDDIHGAEVWLDKMSQGAMRDRLGAELQAALGEVQSKKSPQSAVAPLGAAIGVFREKIPARLPKLLLERGEAWRAIHDLDRSEEDLYAAVQALDEERANLLGQQIKDSFFEQARDIFEAVIDLQVSERKDPERGFLDAERLHEFLTTPPGPNTATAENPDIRELQAELPESVSLIEYVKVREALFVWVLDRSHLGFLQIDISQRKLRRQVSALQAALSRRASAQEMAPLAKNLYDVLLRPVSRRTQLRSTLIIVPDAWLYMVPFAGLLDRGTGRYLVEDKYVGIAPSGVAYVSALRRSRSLNGSIGHRALVIGNPAFDRNQFPELSDLPEAEREARWIADLYDADLLTRAQATKSNVLRRLPDYDLIHWAGHAGIHSSVPLLSYLLLAPEGAGEAGVLYAHDIQRLNFTKTRVVVLSACQSAGSAEGEGMAGLARAFLVAGVPAVVGHLWPLKDGEETQFIEEFHRGLIAGKNPLSALHAAQISAISREDRGRRGSATWAGFQIMGGGIAE